MDPGIQNISSKIPSESGLSAFHTLFFSIKAYFWNYEEEKIFKKKYSNRIEQTLSNISKIVAPDLGKQGQVVHKTLHNKKTSKHKEYQCLIGNISIKWGN